MENCPNPRSDVRALSAAYADRIHLFASRVTCARQQLGISKSELGRRVSKNYREVLRWERARHAPTLHSLHDLANVLKVTISYLVGEQRPPPVITLDVSSDGRTVGATRGSTMADPTPEELAAEVALQNAKQPRAKRIGLRGVVGAGPEAAAERERQKLLANGGPKHETHLSLGGLHKNGPAGYVGL